MSAGHRLAADDLTIETGCEIEVLASCHQLVGRVTTTALAAGAEVAEKDTIALDPTQTVVTITLGDDATLTEPFSAGDHVRIMLSPLPDTNVGPAILDAMMIAVQTDPERVLVAFTPSDLERYLDLAGRARADVVGSSPAST